MFEKAVIFQSRRFALNQLTSSESVADAFPLVDFLYEKKLKIDKEPALPGSSGYS